jgi:hypothetical protein
MIIPSVMNAICLNKYTNVFPLYNLYANELVALYTTSKLTSDKTITIAQITLSPFVLSRKPLGENLADMSVN